MALFEKGAEVRLEDEPQANKIRVALNRVRKCPAEIAQMPGSDAEEESPSPPEDRDHGRVAFGPGTACEDDSTKDGDVTIHVIISIEAFLTKGAIVLRCTLNPIV